MFFSFCLDDPGYDDKTLDGYKSCLSKEELSRYLRFKNDVRQKAFLIGHGELRHHLSIRLKVKPECLDLYYSKNGKLLMRNGYMHFSLSHTGNMVFLVISNKNVGIDCERIIDRDFDKLAKFIFPDHVAKSIISEKNLTIKKNIFYDKWTEREAAIKYFDEKLFNKDIECKLNKLTIYRFLACDDTIKLAVIKNECN